MQCNGCQLNTTDNQLINTRVDMLTSYDWLGDLPDTSQQTPIIEVRFKGTRKEFFINNDSVQLKRGDIVVLAATGGHDVGIVSLTGRLAEMQFDRKIKSKERYTWFNVHRVARESDIEKWNEAQKREKPVMIRARQIADQLKLDMKIGDVEFRGDGKKAIFYYIADGRVDFRELIKIYAREFQIKIEMKQIGVRQEAARIGGIGSCGRELCCSSWRTDFSSINAHTAIRQGLSPNAEKLTGRCGKLKCCLMYELDSYLEAQADFPVELLSLETSQGVLLHIKTDILQKQITYSIQTNKQKQTISLPLEKVKQVIQLNKRGEKPDLATLTEKTDSNLTDSNMFNKNLTASSKLEKKIRTNKQAKRHKKGLQK